MTQYLLSLYQPDGPAPAPAELSRIMEDLDAVNRDLRAAGAWVFAGGLQPPAASTVVRATGGKVLRTDGPFVESKEHLGGFTIIEAPDLDAALAWGERVAQASTLPVEVRPFQAAPGG